MTHLRADCESCFGLCCVVPALCAGGDFAIDKPARQPCPNLDAGFHCGIHDRLRQRGFTGCEAYDCFGAGQRVAQETFAGRDWRRAPHLAAKMFEAFAVMVRLHELLWYLTEALARPEALPLREEIQRAHDQTAALAGSGPEALVAIAADAHLEEASVMLRQVSALVRAAARNQHGGQGRRRTGNGPGAQWHRADLIGRKLRNADLRGADLGGALLIGADLSRADLTGADLLGADLRAANLAGANLAGALFVTHTQIQGALGDAKTTLPGGLVRPAHWQAPAIPNPAIE